MLPKSIKKAFLPKILDKGTFSAISTFLSNSSKADWAALFVNFSALDLLNCLAWIAFLATSGIFSPIASLCSKASIRFWLGSLAGFITLSPSLLTVSVGVNKCVMACSKRFKSVSFKVPSAYPLILSVCDTIFIANPSRLVPKVFNFAFSASICVISPSLIILCSAKACSIVKPLSFNKKFILNWAAFKAFASPASSFCNSLFNWFCNSCEVSDLFCILSCKTLFKAFCDAWKICLLFSADLFISALVLANSFALDKSSSIFSRVKELFAPAISSWLSKKIWPCTLANFSCAKFCKFCSFLCCSPENLASSKSPATLNLAKNFCNSSDFSSNTFL